jgi:integrase/recombinase XerD
MSDETRYLYRRGAVWWFEIRIEGRKIRESLDTDEVVVARQRRDKRIAELRVTGGVKLGWDEVSAEWAKWFVGKRFRSPDTYQRYLDSLLQVRPFISKYDVDKIDGKIIVNLINQRRKMGVTDATIRRDLTAVSAVLKYAEDQNWREGNPAVAKRRMLEESAEAIVLPVNEDIDAVIDACPWRFAAIVRAARLTGCRQDELITARWDQFNDNRRTLTIIGKRNKRRTIDLNDEAFALIRSHPRVVGSPLIFAKEDGGMFLNPATYFGKLREKASQKVRREIEFRFHDLRHLYAVEALHGGMSIYKLQKQLGHSTIKMTERYLEFVSPEEQEQAQRGEVMDLPGADSAGRAHI